MIFRYFSVPDLWITDSSSGLETVTQVYKFQLDNGGPGSTLHPTFVVFQFRNILEGIHLANISQVCTP